MNMQKHNTMKTTRLYMLFALLLMMEGVKAQQWKTIETGVSEDLYNVCCIDASTVFVCGQNGVILKSSDCGVHWTEKYRRRGCQMTELCFAEPNVGYAVCDSTIDEYSHQWFLVKTCDGGETWNAIGEPVMLLIDCYTGGNRFVRTEMFPIDVDSLVVAVSFDGIYKTTDGGLSLRKVSSFTINETRGLFLEDNVGYLIWEYGEEDFIYGERLPGIAKTEDHGDTWSIIDSVASTMEGVAFARFYDKNHIRLFGGFHTSLYSTDILETNDGFDTFEPIGDMGTEYFMPYYEVYIRAKFTDNNWGVCMLWEEDWPGVGRSVSYTEDDGLTWTYYSGYGLPTDRLYDIDGTDTTFFISCAEGIILKNRQFTLMGTDELVSQVVTIYPNPAKDRVVVEGISLSEVQVYNTLGQLVNTIQGTNEISVSGLPSGIYLLHITATDGKTYKTRLMVRK